MKFEEIVLHWIRQNNFGVKNWHREKRTFPQRKLQAEDRGGPGIAVLVARRGISQAKDTLSPCKKALYSRELKSGCFTTAV